MSNTSTDAIIYRPRGFEHHPPLTTASVTDFLFNSPHAEIDDTPAFVDALSGTKLSRKELYDLSLRLGKGVERLGLRKGKDVAMIFSPNSLAWPITFFGLLSLGITTTLANSSYTPSELTHQLTDSRAHLIFSAPSLFPTLLSTLKLLGVGEEEARKRVVVMSFTKVDEEEEGRQGIDKGWRRLGQLFEHGKLVAPIRLTEKETDETTLMCYSSGTTGLSKGVETTHRNIVSVLQMFAAVAPPVDRSTDVEIGLLPLYHIFGIIKVLCFSFWVGVPVVIVPKFEPLSFFKIVETYKISIIKLVPPILVVLATHPAFDTHDLTSIRYMLSGAAPLGEGLTKRVIARFEKHQREKGRGQGVRIVQGYGLTETSPTAVCLAQEDALRKLGSIGVLMPGLEARLVDDEGKDVQPVQGSTTRGPGELWFRGPTIMKGYLNNPTATANSITPDGWFQSGDIGVVDEDGFYYIVDRKKELIKYKGFQVPPADLEAVLLTKEDIADCGVIGVESKELATELPRAYVVSTAPIPTSNAAARAKFEKDVAEWIKTKVAPHKFLRGGVKLVDSIPKSPAGKILRRQLRDLAKQEAKEALEASLSGNSKTKL